MFKPVSIPNLFSEEDIALLRKIVSDGSGREIDYDANCKRVLIQHDLLESYFSKKIEPLAREIFNDPSLVTTITSYAHYDNHASMLPPHKDRGPTTYVIDYCLSSKTMWPLNVDDVSYDIFPGDALAFVGERSVHGRGPMPEPETNSVEMVFFNFVPKEHWYFIHCDDFKLDS